MSGDIIQNAWSFSRKANSTSLGGNACDNKNSALPEKAPLLGLLKNTRPSLKLLDTNWADAFGVEISLIENIPLGESSRSCPQDTDTFLLLPLWRRPFIVLPPLRTKKFHESGSGKKNVTRFIFISTEQNSPLSIAFYKYKFLRGVYDTTRNNRKSTSFTILAVIPLSDCSSRWFCVTC